MSHKWDGIPRRKNDLDSDGKITTAVFLARIDERVNTLIENALEVKKDLGEYRNNLDEHKKDDDRRFLVINKTIWGAGGALTVIIFVLDIVFHKG